MARQRGAACQRRPAAGRRRSGRPRPLLYPLRSAPLERCAPQGVQSLNGASRQIQSLQDHRQKAPTRPSQDPPAQQETRPAPRPRRHLRRRRQEKPVTPREGPMYQAALARLRRHRALLDTANAALTAIAKAAPGIAADLRRAKDAPASAPSRRGYSERSYGRTNAPGRAAAPRRSGPPGRRKWPRCA